MFIRRGLQVVQSFSRSSSVGSTFVKGSRRNFYQESFNANPQTSFGYSFNGSKMLLGLGIASLTTIGFVQWNDDKFKALAAEKVPIYGVPGTKKERTFIAIKPDGVQRNLVGEVISRFEQKGYKLVAIKLVTPTKQFAEKHYSDLSSRPFFPSLVKYFSSGPVVAMVWEGKNAIVGGRKLVGATDPNVAEPGSIRGDHAIAIGRNIIHGSDSPDSAKAEISLWFKEEEVSDYDANQDKWIHEN